MRKDASQASNTLPKCILATQDSLAMTGHLYKIVAQRVGGGSEFAL